MSVAAMRMNRLTLRYADADAEQAFALEQAQKSLRPIRVALIVVAAISTILAAMVLLGIYVIPGLIGADTHLRRGAGIGLAFCTIVYAVTHSRFFIRRHQWVLFAVVCAISASIIRFAYVLPHEVLTTRGFVLLLIHIFTIYSVFRLRILAATAASVLSVCAYLGFLVGAGLLSGPDVARHALALAIANAWGIVICYQMELATRREFIAMRELGEERARSERLLLNILPASIAERLKASDAAIADHSDEVTVLFADIVGFTPLSARKTPQALVELLDRVFTEFDALAETHGLEKIKTIGDAYMAVAGIPERRADHAQAAARMAQGMLEAIARVAADTGEALSIRVGLHSGPVVAGVIGRKKFIYDLWGDTVNTASRMESHGVPGAVQCSEATAALLGGEFALSARGPVEVEGKGEMHTFLLMATGAPQPAGRA